VFVTCSDFSILSAEHDSEMDGGTVKFLIFLLIIILIKESFMEVVSLEATSRGLPKSGNTITWVTWKDLTTPLEIGINPQSLKSLDDYCVGYTLPPSCKGWKSGAGLYQFMALNMRVSCGIGLFESYPRDAEAVPLNEDQNPLPTVSPAVRFHHPNQLSPTSQQPDKCDTPSNSTVGWMDPTSFILHFLVD
jgi:hypothetical protein